MSGPDMVAFIVLVVMIASVLRTYLKYRADRGAAGLSAEDSTRIARLEQRVQALESIVTDQGYDLKQKFKELERT